MKMKLNKKIYLETFDDDNAIKPNTLYKQYKELHNYFTER